jgi:hypothetical protein
MSTHNPAGRSLTMLQEFISANREAIVSRASQWADGRVWPSRAYSEFEQDDLGASKQAVA